MPSGRNLSYDEKQSVENTCALAESLKINSERYKKTAADRFSDPIIFGGLITAIAYLVYKTSSVIPEAYHLDPENSADTVRYLTSVFTGSTVIGVILDLPQDIAKIYKSIKDTVSKRELNEIKALNDLRDFGIKIDSRDPMLWTNGKVYMIREAGLKGQEMRVVSRKEFEKTFLNAKEKNIPIVMVTTKPGSLLVQRLQGGKLSDGLNGEPAYTLAHYDNTKITSILAANQQGKIVRTEKYAFDFDKVEKPNLDSAKIDNNSSTTDKGEIFINYDPFKTR